MRINELKPEFSKFIPKEIEDGILYISEEYAAVIHNCCCGCGEKVSTPIGKDGWVLTKKDGAVTLSPSIGNWKYKCRSHYYIRDNKVIWL